MIMNKIQKNLSPKNTFFCIALINVMIMFWLLMFSNGSAMLAMGYGESLFCDFWRHIDRLLNYESIYGNLKDADAIFPPLAYWFLMFFAKMVAFKNVDGATTREIATSGYGILVFVMYLVLFIVLFAQIISYAYHGNNFYKSTLVLILVCSYPFWGCAFERGNPVIWSMLFLLIGLALREHKKWYIRELALICIAISAGFKLYPAIFGMLFIAEKKIKEACRLLVYGLLSFFIPFLLLGDRANLVDYLGTFERYLDKKVYSQTSILGNCVMIFGDQGLIWGKLIILALIIWAVVYLFLEKVNWKSIALLTAINTIVLPESYLYTYVYICIPLIFFLNERRKVWKKIDYLYAVCFALIFTCPPYSIYVEGAIFRGIYFAWIFMLLMISCEKIYEICRRHKSHIC